MQHLITTVRHPRADHPGSPWTGFLNEVLAASDNNVEVVRRQRSLDVRTLPQPNIDWISNALEPPAPPFDPIYLPPSEFELKQYRSPASNFSYIESQPNEGWFAGAQTLWEVWHGVPSRDQAQSYLAPGRPLTSIETNRDLPWLSTPLNLWEVPYHVPAHSEMQSFLPRSSLQAGPPEGQEQEYAYLRQTIPPPVETFPAIKQLLDSFEMRARYSVFDCQPQDAWIFSNIPVPFDTTVVAATYELLRSFIPASSIKWMGPELGDFAWIKENLPVASPYSTEMIAATFELLRSFVTPSANKWYSPEQPNIDWVFPLTEVLAASVIDFLPRAANRFNPHYHDTPSDVGWLFENVPPVVPFDPVNFRNAFETLLWSRPKFDLRLIQQPQEPPSTFIMVDMMAPYLHGDLTDPKPRTFDSRYITDPDFAWIYRNLPPLVSQLMSFSHGELPTDRPRQLDNRYLTYSDVSWLFENLPPSITRLMSFSHGELPTEKARGLDGRYLTHTDISWIFENLPPVVASLLRPMRTKNWHRNR